MSRPSWDAYFIALTNAVATRATCDRKHVGALIVQGRHIVATGYNGSPPGLAHCDEVGHQLVVTDGRSNCVRTTHAELNALLQAARYGVRVEGATLYVNTRPCWNCAKAIITAGVKRIVVDKPYDNDVIDGKALEITLAQAGVEIEYLVEGGE